VGHKALLAAAHAYEVLGDAGFLLYRTLQRYNDFHKGITMGVDDGSESMAAAADPASATHPESRNSVPPSPPSGFGTAFVEVNSAGAASLTHLAPKASVEDSPLYPTPVVTAASSQVAQQLHALQLPTTMAQQWLSAARAYRMAALEGRSGGSSGSSGSGSGGSSTTAASALAALRCYSKAFAADVGDCAALPLRTPIWPLPFLLPTGIAAVCRVGICVEHDACSPSNPSPSPPAAPCMRDC
jgi:hypothetical protein